MDVRKVELTKIVDGKEYMCSIVIAECLPGGKSIVYKVHVQNARKSSHWKYIRFNAYKKLETLKAAFATEVEAL